MEKGKTGIMLPYIAVLAFVLAIFNQPLLCGLLFLAVIIIEKNDWLSRQCLQALLLTLVFSFANGVLGTLSNVFGGGGLFGVVSALFSVLTVLVWVGLLIFAIIAIVNCLKGNDAEIPIICTLAYKAFGAERPHKPKYNPNMYQMQNYQSPQNPQVPQGQYQQGNQWQSQSVVSPPVQPPVAPVGAEPVSTTVSEATSTPAVQPATVQTAPVEVTETAEVKPSENVTETEQPKE